MFPFFRPWLEENVEGMDIDETKQPQESIELPPAIVNNGIVTITITITIIHTYSCIDTCLSVNYSLAIQTSSAMLKATMHASVSIVWSA